MSDHLKNIMSCLYNETTYQVYNIVKKFKIITNEELIKKLKEMNKFVESEIKVAIGVLVRGDYIKQIQTIQKDDKKKKCDSLKYNYFQLNSLKNIYEKMKENLKEEFDDKETNKYLCRNCNEKTNTNMAMRSNFLFGASFKFLLIGEK